ncbi:methylaspartate mutase [Micromonospora sp. NPDC002296]|uniref:methylaspartate mutase n=1 Tax=Micromonospora sp. NPDC002296 TaxID=3154271 RepID=UPI003330EAB6
MTHDVSPRPEPRSFGEHVRSIYGADGLVVQPRMGFGTPGAMRAGLVATKETRARTVGTITVDSYTRVGDHGAALRALDSGMELNGYPIVDHPIQVTRNVIDGVLSPDFPIQVRHGSARPGAITRALLRAGLNATEGGPVSYCLPYGRVPLQESIVNWSEASAQLAAESGGLAHLETFGGCLLGQLCPPSLLVAVSVLEARFFALHGIKSLSLSYAQQTNFDQDVEAVVAMRQLAGEFVPAQDVHYVIYAYMGVYPRTRTGALQLLRQAARLAVHTDSERLIVKTAAEAHRIPTIAENVEALEVSSMAARLYGQERKGDVRQPLADLENPTYREARRLIEAVLGLSSDLNRSLSESFRLGYLDVPFCLHPDNAGQSRSYIDDEGRLQWSSVGGMPISPAVRGTSGRPAPLTSRGLLAALNFARDNFDRPALTSQQSAIRED